MPTATTLAVSQTRSSAGRIGETDEETLIMADEFRTMYLKSNIVYANQFMLDAGSGFWTLYDSDMETPA